MMHFNALALLSALGLLLLLGCGSDEGGSSSNTGGTTGSGGNTMAAGGDTSSGGEGAGTGGSGNSATGGAGSGGEGNNPSAVVATCEGQTYTPNAAQTGVCAGADAHGGPIADFELADHASWFGAYANGSEGTTTSPATFEANPVNRVAGGANGTSYSVHYAGTGFSEGFRLHTAFDGCQNVAEFQGLSFWAKGTTTAEDGGWEVGQNEIVVQLGSQNSVLDTEGGDCTSDCGGHPDFRVALTDQWTEYQISFDCFGDGLVFNGHVLSLLFVVRGSNFDVSIDEISFY